MTNKYYQTHKEKLWKEEHARYKIFLQKKKKKVEIVSVIEFFWGTKTEARWIYKNLLFTT